MCRRSQRNRILAPAMLPLDVCVGVAATSAGKAALIGAKAGQETATIRRRRLCKRHRVVGVSVSSCVWFSTKGTKRRKEARRVLYYREQARQRSVAWFDNFRGEILAKKQEQQT